MNILFIGDIFASPGRRIVADHVQDIIETNHIDLAIANAENAAGGFGITPAIAEELLALGLDVLTSGNHVWDKRELYDYFARQPRLLRPANYAGVPGSGAVVRRARNGVDCAVINLQGRTYMPSTDCPFRKADEILGALDPAVKVKFVDFHAEVTSEKIALGRYLDGRVEVRGLPRGSDQRKNRLGPLSGRTRLGGGGNAYARAHGRYPHPRRRHRLPDGLRHDRSEEH